MAGDGGRQASRGRRRREASGPCPLAAGGGMWRSDGGGPRPSAAGDDGREAVRAPQLWEAACGGGRRSDEGGPRPSAARGGPRRISRCGTVKTPGMEVGPPTGVFKIDIGVGGVISAAFIVPVGKTGTMDSLEVQAGEIQQMMQQQHDDLQAYFRHQGFNPHSGPCTRSKLGGRRLFPMKIFDLVMHVNTSIPHVILTKLHIFNL
uniref:Uncharacterized protein n=1 Tax=Oryza barthii TaxID=65489 RepID=A0A0D3F5F9_9ORYZ